MTVTINPVPRDKVSLWAALVGGERSQIYFPQPPRVEDDTWWQHSMWGTLGGGQHDAAEWGDDCGASW